MPTFDNFVRIIGIRRCVLTPVPCCPVLLQVGDLSFDEYRLNIISESLYIYENDRFSRQSIRKTRIKQRSKGKLHRNQTRWCQRL